MSNRSKRNFRVAISGKSGCGATTVCDTLAKELGFEMINYTLRSLAQDRGVSFKEACRLAEQGDEWDRTVDRIQVERAMEGSCVVGSRLAIWLLKEVDLRVFLVASLDVRSKRIRTREGGTFEERQEQTRQRDQRDARRFKVLHGIDTGQYDFADLIVNTNRLDSKSVVSVILAAAKSLLAAAR